jgi:hypothetical protein
MSVRAKLKCVSIVGEKVDFMAMYNSEDTEADQTFSKFTPYGAATLGVSNPDAHKQFEINQFYYFDITPVPPKEKQE